MSYRNHIVVLALLLSTLVGVLCVVYAVIVRDSQPTHINGTFSQLRIIHASIENELFVMTKMGKEANVDIALYQLTSRHGYGYVVSAVDQKTVLQVNRNGAKWMHLTNYSDDVAIVSPVPFKQKRSGDNVYVGISFGGKKVVLSHLPTF